MKRMCAVFAGALVFAGSAGATVRQPFPGLHPLRFLPLIELRHASHGRKSCTAQPRTTRTRVARFSRRIDPVACEQPPRSKVRDAGSVVILAP